jgi:glycosyltransferase involved in cell wall biosynthesis
MARAVLDLVGDPGTAADLVRAGRESVQQYTWAQVWPRLLAVYRGITESARPAAATGTK